MGEDLNKNHNVIIEDRKRFILTGIKDVLTFDEENIVLETALGRLAIKGAGLRITNFNNELNDLTGEGKIFAFIYTADEKEGGFWSRLLK